MKPQVYDQTIGGLLHVRLDSFKALKLQKDATSDEQKVFSYRHFVKKGIYYRR